MTTFRRLPAVLLVLAGTVLWSAQSVHAGDRNGDFMVRILGSVVAPDADADVRNAAGLIAGADADINTRVIPAATLTYFFTNNIAAELFCCFTKHTVEAQGSIAALGDLGDSWIFPPVVTLQYHFDPMNGFKPYVGAGVQYMLFFNESGNAALGDMSIDNAWGFALQAGVDIEVGDGWYLNADVKKVWLETDASWAGGVNADVNIDPWIISAGVGYRFNLSDIFGSRGGVDPLK